MFGNFKKINENSLVDQVRFEIQQDARYQSSNSDQVVMIDTPFARVYINQDSYLANVPESVWMAHFENEASPEQWLKAKIGHVLQEHDVKEFQDLLSDLIDAEFNAKNRSL